MSYYKSKGWNNLVRYFPMPNIIFQLGLSPQEIAIYAYLMCIEDRKTYQCHPSYSTIGKSCGISVNTVRKYVESLEHRGLIHTEPTKVKTRDGRTHNGSLLYTILPIQPIVDDYYQEQLSLAEYYSAYTKAMKEHEKKYGGVNIEKVNV